MKKPFHFLLPLFLSLVLANPLFGQTRQVLATAGGDAFVAGAGKKFEFTLGEPIILTVGNNENTLTQGFHQPERISVGISEIAEASGLSIFPNPTSEELHLRFDAPTGQTFQLQVVNAAGQLVQTLPKSDDTVPNSVDCRLFPSGTYFLLAHTADGSLFFQVPFVKAVR